MTDGFILSFDELQPYEVGGYVLTALIYPEAFPPSSFLDQRLDELCGYLLHYEAEHDPEGALDYKAMRPIHALLPQSRISVADRRVRAELPKRILAGGMALRLVQAEGHRQAESRSAATSSSINSVAELAAEAAGLSTASNVSTRVFRPSYPVLHICAAASHLLEMSLPDCPDCSVLDMLLSEPRIRELVQLAEHLEEAILTHPKLKVDPEKLIRIRLQPGS